MCMLANQRPYHDIFWAYNLILAHHSNPVRGGVSKGGAAARFQPLGTMFCSVYFDRRCIKLLRADQARQEHPSDAVESWGHMQEWAKLQPAWLRLAELWCRPLWRAALWTLPCVSYLRIAVEDKDVSCAVVFQVGDLQAAGVADFSRLEGGIEGLNFHHRFGVSGLHRRVRGSFVVEVSFQTSLI